MLGCSWTSWYCCHQLGVSAALEAALSAAKPGTFAEQFHRVVGAARPLGLGVGLGASVWAPLASCAPADGRAPSGSTASFTAACDQSRRVQAAKKAKTAEADKVDVRKLEAAAELLDDILKVRPMRLNMRGASAQPALAVACGQRAGCIVWPRQCQ